MHIYIVDYLGKKFSRFLRDAALVLELSFDSTPMRIFSVSEVSQSVEVFARLVTAHSSTGEKVSLHPELTAPTNTKVSGVLAALSPSCFVTNRMFLI